MKQLNQIILCCDSEGRSFLRELAVFEEFAMVTHIEALPFRYHETLKELKKSKEKVSCFTMPVKRTNRHTGCPFCGNTGTFQCNHCGHMSCWNTALPEQICPGCKKAYKAAPVEARYASGSGFIEDGLQSKETPEGNKTSSEADLWKRANGNLLKLIGHRNQRPS